MANQSMLAGYGEKWIKDYLANEYKGAQFAWSKEKADHFAAIDIETLLFDKYFLNCKNWIYPGIADTIFELWEERKKRQITLIAILAGFGVGKTVLASIINWLIWLEFTCKYDPKSEIACPQEYYNLKPDSKIAFIALSKSLQKSKDITFGHMKSAFNSQFNQDYFPINPIIKSKLVIDRNYTTVFPNTASEAAIAGYDVFAYVMDEISFLEVVDNSARSKGIGSGTYDQAKFAHMSAEGRKHSRFGDDGMGMLISSVNYDEDYLVSLMRKAYAHIDSENIFYKILLPWEVNPAKFNKSKQYFYFDTTKYEIVEDKKEINLLDKYYVHRPIEDIVFGDNDNDANDKLLCDCREGRVNVEL